MHNKKLLKKNIRMQIKIPINLDTRELIIESIEVVNSESREIAYEVQLIKLPPGVLGFTGLEIAATVTASVALINLCLNIYDRLKLKDKVTIEITKETRTEIIITKEITKEILVDQITKEIEDNS